jgi:phosphoserine aminotransferase
VASNMSDIFDGGAYVGVLNAPDLGAVARAGPDVAKFVGLSEAFGAILGQRYRDLKLRGITITVAGEQVADDNVVDVIKSAVLKGCLSTFTTANTTMVNAASTAETMGLPVTANITGAVDSSSAFTNKLKVQFHFDDDVEASLEGTVLAGAGMRITRVGDLAVACPPGEHMIFFENTDQPGVLLRLADVLGSADINIENFSLGRTEKNGRAIGCLVIDRPCSETVMTKLRSIDSIDDIRQVDVPMSPVNDCENKPEVLPRHPEFSSGPCKKRPGWKPQVLRQDVLGRSHRSKLGKARLAKAIADTKRLLRIPDDYLVGIVPASDTGAFEMAMWTMLGERPIDACYWESFGHGWKDDAIKHLGLSDMTREFTAPYGELPDLAATNPDHDIMFTYNGTTSGVKVPNLDWISDDRTGLTFNDATSAVFAMDVDWSKVDVTTYSWQKVLGGEGAHGMMILSPRAVARLESYIPENRPMPKIFRLTKKVNGETKINGGIFKGETINTPSMLCVEDYIDALAWCDKVGGLDGLIARSEANLNVLERFVARNEWIDFLAQDPTIRSNTSVCLKLNGLDAKQVKAFCALLEKERAAYDIGSYRDAPDGLRIWCGATVCVEDLENLLPWLTWAYTEVGGKIE